MNKDLFAGFVMGLMLTIIFLVVVFCGVNNTVLAFGLVLGFCSGFSAALYFHDKLFPKDR